MRLYQRLTPERKATLDSRIADLNAKYRTNETFDYDALCNDMDIRYYEHVDIVQPTTLPRHVRGEKRDWSKPPKIDVYNFPFRVTFVREYNKVHEFAHVIFGHNRGTSGMETEANYFARQMTGVRIPDFLIDVISAIEIIAQNKKLVDYYQKNDNPLGELYHADLRKLAETISPVHQSNS